MPEDASHAPAPPDAPADWPSSLARFQSIVQNAVEGIFQSSPDGRFLLVNPALARMYGYDSAEQLRESVQDISRSIYVDPAIRRDFQRQMERDGEVHGLEYQVRRRDGSVIWICEHSRAVRNDRGDVLYYEGFIQDISRRKRAEEELRTAKEAAEAASRAKSQFLAVMSHEIRTPMNGVIGMTSLLLGSSLNGEQRELAETIRQSGDALLGIINDILDFSKIESGRLELEREEFNLRDCIDGALDIVAARAAEKRLELLCDVAPGAPTMIRGDVTCLRQVLVNLLGNAVKFTERGEVLLSVHTELCPTGRLALHFSVRDTGIGISRDAIERVFQSFSQADASTTRRYGGTGLGLAISRRLVELMGGTLSVTSELGQGSTFRFHALVDPVATSTSHPIVAARSQLAGRRLLVVSGNPTGRRILIALAKRWGLVTHAVETDREALALVQAGDPFDFALIDTPLDAIDVSALGRALRQLRPASALPLLQLAAIGQLDATTDDGLFTARLHKPVKPVQLLRAFTSLPELGRDPSGNLPPLRADSFEPERVLLAEDNFVNQKVALQMLSRLGYQADLAANGHEVLRAVEHKTYDIILMDVDMPELDGLETTRRLRTAQRADRPWIIALTANALAGDREACLATGMNDYLRKPLKLQELAAALRRARQKEAA